MAEKESIASKIFLSELARKYSYSIMAGISTISLLVISISLLPISKKAAIWNGCIKTTSNHLKENGFQANDSEIEATSVVLCTGSSIPARRQSSNPQPKD